MIRPEGLRWHSLVVRTSSQQAPQRHYGVVRPGSNFAKPASHTRPGQKGGSGHHVSNSLRHRSAERSLSETVNSDVVELEEAEEIEEAPSARKAARGQELLEVLVLRIQRVGSR